MTKKDSDLASSNYVETRVGALYEDLGEIDSLDISLELSLYRSEGGKPSNLDASLIDAVVILKEQLNNDDISVCEHRSKCLIEGDPIKLPSDASVLAHDALEVANLALLISKFQAFDYSEWPKSSPKALAQIQRFITEKSVDLGRMHDRMMKRAKGLEAKLGGKISSEKTLSVNRQDERKLSDAEYIKAAQEVKCMFPRAKLARFDSEVAKLLTKTRLKSATTDDARKRAGVSERTVRRCRTRLE